MDRPKTTNFKLDALDFRIVLGLDSMKLKSTSDDMINDKYSALPYTGDQTTQYYAPLLRMTDKTTMFIIQPISGQDW